MTWTQTVFVALVAVWLLLALGLLWLVAREAVDAVRRWWGRRQMVRNLRRALAEGRPVVLPDASSSFPDPTDVRHYEGPPWCFTLRPDDLPNLDLEEKDRP